MMMAMRAAPPTDPPMIAASGTAEELGAVVVPGHAPTGPLVTAAVPHCAAAETYALPVERLDALDSYSEKPISCVCVMTVSTDMAAAALDACAWISTCQVVGAA